MVDSEIAYAVSVWRCYTPFSMTVCYSSTGLMYPTLSLPPWSQPISTGQLHPSWKLAFRNIHGATTFSQDLVILIGIVNFLSSQPRSSHGDSLIYTATTSLRSLMHMHRSLQLRRFALTAASGLWSTNLRCRRGSPTPSDEKLPVRRENPGHCRRCCSDPPQNSNVKWAG